MLTKAMAMANQVDKDEFKRLEEKYPNEHDPGFEYSADDKEIVLLALPTPIHQHITLALQGWLNNIGEEELSTPDRAYFADTECPVMLVDGSSKVPDAALVTSPRGLYPIVAVEVGFSEPLEKLYHDAEVLLKGSRDWIELVIILKIYESGHYQRPSNVYPWDETVERLEAMSDEELASTIETYFVSNQLRIVGDLTVDVLLYPKSRKTRPRKPVYTFVHPRQSSDQALAPRPPMVSIQGQKFRFPVRKVNLAIERGVAREEARRILDGIREAGLLR